MDICHLKNAELEPKSKIFKGRVVLRNDIVIDDSGASAVFSEHRWSAVQMAAAKVMDVIARLPDCDGQTADAASAYTQVKSEDASRLLTIPKSECPDVWIRLPRHKWPNSWAIIEDGTFRTKLKLDTHWQDCCGKNNSRKFYWNLDGEKEPNWDCLFVHRNQGIFLSVNVDDTKKWLERSRIWLPGGRNWWKTLILTNQLHFLITYTWDVLNVNANRMKLLLRNTHRCLNHVFLLEQLKSCQGGRSFTQSLWHGPTTWKDMLDFALSETVNWQTRKWSKYTKFQVLAWMITNSNRKNLDQLENYHKFAHKLS